MSFPASLFNAMMMILNMFSHCKESKVNSVSFVHGKMVIGRFLPQPPIIDRPHRKAGCLNSNFPILRPLLFLRLHNLYISV